MKPDPFIESRITLRATVNNLEFEKFGSNVKTHIRSDMINKIATAIYDRMIKMEIEKFQVTFSIDIYVLEPETLWRLINDKAREMFYLMERT